MLKLDQRTDDALTEAKRRILANLVDRAGAGGEETDPSVYWSGYCERLQYLTGLDNEHFLRVRDHTWQITGDVYNRYLPPLEAGYRSRLEDAFGKLWDGLPDRYRLSEPERTFGLEIGGSVVNTDLLRFQRLVIALRDEGILDQVGGAGSGTVVEIGGGYGGFAHQLAACLGEDLDRYVIVDLPEVLLLAAAYLIIHDGVESVHVHDPADPAETIRQLADGPATFVLVPNHRADLIDGRSIDLAVNIASFQEMTSEQVAGYLSTIARNLTGTLVSFNRPFNMEANVEQENLRALLDRHFAWRTAVLPLTESPPFRARANRAARSMVRRSLGRPTRFSEYELILAEAR